jgi:hypothetical protein
VRFLLSVFLIACGASDKSDAADASPTYPHSLASLTDTCAGNPNLTGAAALAMIGPTLTATFTPSGDAGAPSTLTASFAPASPLSIRCEPAAPAWIRMSVTAVISTSDGTFADETFTGELDLSTDDKNPRAAFVVSKDNISLAAQLPPLQGLVIENPKTTFTVLGSFE